MAERDEQIKLFNWINCHPLIKDVSFYIPNDGKRSIILGRIMKRMGLRPGTPDVFIAYPTKTLHGLFIELKYGKNKATPAQSRMLELLSNQGYMAELAWGAEEAIDLVMKYLKT